MSYLCPRLQHSGSPLGRAHVRRSAFLAWAFFMPISHPYSGCHLVYRTALWVSHYVVTNGMCSRFSVSAPVQFAGRLQHSAICNRQQSILTVPAGRSSSQTRWHSCVVECRGLVHGLTAAVISTAVCSARVSHGARP